MSWSRGLWNHGAQYLNSFKHTVVLHVDITNAFNIVLCRSFLGAPNNRWQLAQLFPFVQAFYDMQLPLLFNHHSHFGKIVVIHSSIGTWQNDPWGRFFFCPGSFIGFVNYLMDFFFSCLFFPIYDDIYIIGFTLEALHVFEHFESHLAFVGLTNLVLQLCNLVPFQFKSQFSLFCWFLHSWGW